MFALPQHCAVELAKLDFINYTRRFGMFEKRCISYITST
jgi:hypothetical protein